MRVPTASQTQQTCGKCAYKHLQPRYPAAALKPLWSNACSIGTYCQLDTAQLAVMQSAEADEKMCLLLSCSSLCHSATLRHKHAFWLHSVFYSVLQRPAVH